MEHYGALWSTVEDRGAAWEMRRWGREGVGEMRFFPSMGLLFRDCGKNIPLLSVLSISGLRERRAKGRDGLGWRRKEEEAEVECVRVNLLLILLVSVDEHLVICGW